MARFTLLLITWVKHTKENRGKVQLKTIDTDIKGTEGKGDSS